MEFALLWIEITPKDKQFGLGLGEIKNCDNDGKNLIAIYWNTDELLIDLFWFRIVGR